MKIGLQISGSFGDVKPFLILAGNLVDAGYQVTLLLIPSDNKDYSYYKNSQLSIRHVWNKPENIRRAFRGTWKDGILEQKRKILTNTFFAILPQIADASVKLCAENDLVIGTKLQFTLICAAESTGTPLVLAEVTHARVMSSKFPPGSLPNLGKWFNRVSWSAVNGLIDGIFLSDINHVRGQAFPFLKKIRGSPWRHAALNIILVSKVFLRAVPEDPKTVICGYPENSQSQKEGSPDSELIQFIQQGTPPVYFTIGSMAMLEEDIGDVIALFASTITALECRGIIQVPERYIKKNQYISSDYIYFTQSVPHRDVFPYCCAVVHHGGAGISHTATLCGCSSVVIPYGFDQPFWARELHRIGVAPPPVRRADLTLTKLQKAISDVISNHSYAEKAKLIKAQMQLENGEATAVKAISELCGKIKEKESHGSSSNLF